MPGFEIGGVGGNGNVAPVESRFYTSFSWEIPSLFQTNTSDNDAILLLKSASLPSIKFEVEKARGASFEYKYAGGVSFDDIKVSWYDSQGVNEFIKNWKRSVFSIETGLQAANVYKKRTIISKYLVDREGDSTPISGQDTLDGTQNYNLFGSWPQVIKESDLTYSEASIKSVEIVISYDYFTITEE